MLIVSMASRMSRAPIQQRAAWMSRALAAQERGLDAPSRREGGKTKKQRGELGRAGARRDAESGMIYLIWRCAVCYSVV